MRLPMMSVGAYRDGAVTSGGVYDPRVSFPMGRLLRVILPSEEPEVEQGFRALAVEIFDDGVVVRFMRLRDLTGQKPPEEAARVWDGVTRSAARNSPAPRRGSADESGVLRTGWETIG